MSFLTLRNRLKLTCLYDRYTDHNGWPLSKVVLVETDNGVELHYPPFDIILSK